MRPPALELTDADLVRLTRLGGSLDRIAEAAGIDPSEVARRLTAVETGTVSRRAPSPRSALTSAGHD